MTSSCGVDQMTNQVNEIIIESCILHDRLRTAVLGSWNNSWKQQR